MRHKFESNGFRYQKVSCKKLRILWLESLRRTFQMPWTANEPNLVGKVIIVDASHWEIHWRYRRKILKHSRNFGKVKKGRNHKALNEKNVTIWAIFWKSEYRTRPQTQNHLPDFRFRQKNKDKREQFGRLITNRNFYLPSNLWGRDLKNKENYKKTQHGSRQWSQYSQRYKEDWLGWILQTGTKILWRKGSLVIFRCRRWCCYPYCQTRDSICSWECSWIVEIWSYIRQHFWNPEGRHWKQRDTTG